MTSYGKAALEVEDEYLNVLLPDEPTGDSPDDTAIGRRKKT